MKNEEYCSLVNEGKFPKDTEVKLGDLFSDERGSILNILSANINSISLIETKAGFERANHYHQNCWHFCYILVGSLEYSERDIEKNDNIKIMTFTEGDLFFSPPFRVHKMRFLTDCKMLTFNKSVKNHHNYETDVCRVIF